MNSARKDGRSFGKARTFTEETEAIRTAIPSTRYKNKWALEVFKEWQYYRATKGETSSEVDDNVQTVDTPFQEMNGESMAYWLGKFVQEVVRRDGQKYPPRSLKFNFFYLFFLFTLFGVHITLEEIFMMYIRYRYIKKF